MRYDAKDIKIIRKVITIVQFVSIVILPEYILNLSLLSLIIPTTLNSLLCRTLPFSSIITPTLILLPTFTPFKMLYAS